MQIAILLRNAVSAMNTMHIRGDEAHLFAGVIDAINSAICALEHVEKEIAAADKEDKKVVNADGSNGN